MRSFFLVFVLMSAAALGGAEEMTSREVQQQREKLQSLANDYRSARKPATYDQICTIVKKLISNESNQLKNRLAALEERNKNARSKNRFKADSERLKAQLERYEKHQDEIFRGIVSYHTGIPREEIVVPSDMLPGNPQLKAADKAPDKNEKIDKSAKTDKNVKSASAEKSARKNKKTKK